MRILLQVVSQRICGITKATNRFLSGIENNPLVSKQAPNPVIIWKQISRLPSIGNFPVANDSLLFIRKLIFSNSITVSATCTHDNPIKKSTYCILFKPPMTGLKSYSHLGKYVQ